MKCLENIFNEIGLNFDDVINTNYDKNAFLRECFEKIFDYCNKKDITNLEKFGNCGDILIFCKALLELHYAYLTMVCEYVSQMTEDYAVKEYPELYLANK